MRMSKQLNNTASDLLKHATRSNLPTRDAITYMKEAAPPSAEVEQGDLRVKAQQQTAAENELALKVIELAHKVDELARSNHDLEQFAYAASHDLQEPLRMVTAYTLLLSERYGPKLDAEANKYILYSVQGATRMQTLILDLLAFSRAGSHGTELVVTDSGRVLDSALLNLESSIRESAAVISRNQLPAVMTNTPQLRQVFHNLIWNAIKFRSVEAPAIHISATRQGKEEWIFAVSDNGIGISVEHRETVFAIFQRLHTREEYAGNGIGLAICKKVIERHGGRIWAESPPEGGTIFKFTLRAAEAELDETAVRTLH
jgi:light-regulated signal transduction histidine kinase (bacteriophytochrome)